MRPVTLMDVRQALRDQRFTELFPELSDEITKAQQNLTCGSCAVPVARKILAEYSDRLGTYFPGRPVVQPADEKKSPAAVPRVYNGPCDGLEAWLRKLPHVPAQVTAARWQNECTVIVFEEA